MDDPAAFRERYPLQTMRLPDGEPFAYRIIAIPPPAQRLCSCRAESGCPTVLPAF